MVGYLSSMVSPTFVLRCLFTRRSEDPIVARRVRPIRSGPQIRARRVTGQARCLFTDARAAHSLTVPLTCGRGVYSLARERRALAILDARAARLFTRVIARVGEKNARVRARDARARVHAYTHAYTHVRVRASAHVRASAPRACVRACEAGCQRRVAAIVYRAWHPPRHSGNPARADRTSARLTPHEAAVEASIVARALDRTPHYEEAHQAHMRAASRWSLIARLSRVPSVRDRARAQIEAHLDAADEVMVRALGALLGTVAAPTEVLS